MKRVIIASNAKVHQDEEFMQQLFNKLKALPRKGGSNDGTHFGYNTRPGSSEGVIFGELDGQGYAVYTKSYRDENRVWHTEFVRYEELDDRGLDAIRGRFSR